MRNSFDGAEFIPRIPKQIMNKIIRIINRILLDGKYLLMVFMNRWKINRSKFSTNHLIYIIKTNFLNIQIVFT
jgi:hypothetical protein